MLIYNPDTKKYVIDPHYLSILPLRTVYDSSPENNNKVGEAKLLWIYHMYNPHSPFKDHRDKEKSTAIVQSVFPQPFIDQQEKKLKDLIQEAELKNKDIDTISDTVVEEGGEVKPKKKPAHVFVPRLKLYDPLDDEQIAAAADWYRDHLEQTPLWAAYEAYKEAIYNLSQIIRNPKSTAGEIKTASTELDTLPLKMEKMRQQAVKDEASTLKVQGDKNIKRSERIESHSTKRRRAEAIAVQTTITD